jgi:hypothetical protein
VVGLPFSKCSSIAVETANKILAELIEILDLTSTDAIIQMQSYSTVYVELAVSNG